MVVFDVCKVMVDMKSTKRCDGQKRLGLRREPS